MQFIIFDLEATCWDGNLLGRQQEIIEIGAFRLNPYGEIQDQFQRFIKPILQPTLSLYCIRLTGIRQEDIKYAKSFEKVIEDFQIWLEKVDAHYLLCSWGETDFNLLKQDCALHRIDDDWLQKYIDLKGQYHNLHQLTTKSGLKKTLSKEGFEFSGDHHRALPDAENLAKIFVKYLDVWQY